MQITLRRGEHSLVRYRGSYARTLRKRILVRRIEDVIGQQEWPRGVYLFTSLDSMTPTQLTTARWLWSRLKEHPYAFVPLNNPNQVIGRYKLLRKLYESGQNSFNVHRLNEIDNVRFPAFVRYENLHRANLTGLLYSQDELEGAIARLLLKGERAEDLIVTEFIDYRDDDGLYRKFGSYVVGEECIARHIFVGNQWMMKVKYARRKLFDIPEIEYVRKNLHLSMLEFARVESGCSWARVDYSFYKGRIQIWEVNDNPEMGKKWRHDLGRSSAYHLFFPRLEAAINKVAATVEPGPAVKLHLPALDVLNNVDDRS